MFESELDKRLLSCAKLQTLLALLNCFNKLPTASAIARWHTLLSPCLIVRYDHIHLNFRIQFTSKQINLPCFIHGRAALCSVSWALLFCMIRDWPCYLTRISCLFEKLVCPCNGDSYTYMLEWFSSRTSAKPLFPFLTVEGVLFLWVCLYNCLRGTERMASVLDLMVTWLMAANYHPTEWSVIHFACADS